MQHVVSGQYLLLGDLGLLESNLQNMWRVFKDLVSCKKSCTGMGHELVPDLVMIRVR